MQGFLGWFYRTYEHTGNSLDVVTSKSIYAEYRRTPGHASLTQKARLRKNKRWMVSEICACSRLEPFYRKRYRTGARYYRMCLVEWRKRPPPPTFLDLLCLAAERVSQETKDKNEISPQEPREGIAEGAGVSVGDTVAALYDRFDACFFSSNPTVPRPKLNRKALAGGLVCLKAALESEGVCPGQDGFLRLVLEQNRRIGRMTPAECAGRISSAVRKWGTHRAVAERMGGCYLGLYRPDDEHYTYGWVRDIVRREAPAHVARVEDSERDTQRKQTISWRLREEVHKTFVGGGSLETTCFCCRHVVISPYRGTLVCGHVIAESRGGRTEVANIRPICSTCNGGMGSTTMTVYMGRHFPENLASINGISTYHDAERYVQENDRHAGNVRESVPEKTAPPTATRGDASPPRVNKMSQLRFWKVVMQSGLCDAKGLEAAMGFGGRYTVKVVTDGTVVHLSVARMPSRRGVRYTALHKMLRVCLKHMNFRLLPCSPLKTLVQ